MREIVVTPELRTAIDWAIKYFSKQIAGKSGFYEYECDERDMRTMQVDFAADVFDLDDCEPSYLRHNALHTIISYYFNEADSVVGKQLWDRFMAMRRDCPKCGPDQIDWVGYEYEYGHPKHRDGVSLWIHRCGMQIDRFTLRILRPPDLVEFDLKKFQYG